jgi:hypothetical protein
VLSVLRLHSIDGRTINEYEAVGGIELPEETKYSGKTCPSATLSTTKPTRPGLGSNLGHNGGKPGANCLSYGAASNAMLKYPSYSQSASCYFVMSTFQPSCHIILKRIISLKGSHF